MRTFRSEWRKLVSVRIWLGLAVAALLYTALNAGVLVALSGLDIGGAPVPALTDPATLRSVYASAGSASVLVLVLGILSMTSEYRHQTITATLLATPQRGRLVAGKMAAAALLGAAIGAACALLSLLILGIGLLVKDSAPVDWADVAAVSAGVVLGFGVYAIVGVGFGSLVRNQIAAITGALIWVLLVESAIVAFWPAIGKWLPGGAFNGVLGVESFGGASYLPVALAAPVLLAYGALFALLAVRTTLQRDIT